MFGLLLFDFDGVLFDTNQIKTKAFELALAEYPADKVAELVAYHKANGGKSRYLKMAYFFEEILGFDESQVLQQQALDNFAKCCEELLPTSSVLSGVPEFLVTAKGLGIPMAICSGGNTKEIASLLEKEKLAGFFTEIWGNEKSKTEHAEQTIVQRYNDVCFFGDSQYDMQVAEQFGFTFGFLNGVTEWAEGAKTASEHGHIVAEYFTELTVSDAGLVKQH